MSINVYATFKSEKDIETVTDGLNRINEEFKYSILTNRDVVIDRQAALVNAAGVYPAPVFIDDSYQFANLANEDSKLLRQQIDGGASVLYIESIERDDLNHVLASLRERATHVIKEGGSVGLDQFAMQASDPVDRLNYLIALCLDGVDGYKAAANHVEDVVYKDLFNEYAKQRETFAKELSDLVKGMGSKPAESHTWLGTLHKNWLKFRATIGMNNDPHAILAEARRGEEAVKEAYAEAFASELPEQVREIIRTQLSEINLAFNRMDVLAGVTQ